jgi:hypothetical protein
LDAKRIPIKEVTDYLEKFGIVKLPVMGQTRVDGIFDISFSFEPEKDGSLEEALQDLGLRLRED